MLSGRAFAGSSPIEPFGAVLVGIPVPPFVIATGEHPDLRPNVRAVTVELGRYASPRRSGVFGVRADEDDDHLLAVRVLAEADAGDVRETAKLCLVSAENVGGGHGAPSRLWAMQGARESDQLAGSAPRAERGILLRSIA